MLEKIIILDCGSQVTTLIGRRLREAGIYCEIQPYYKPVSALDERIKGVIISGSPCSVNDVNAPSIDLPALEKTVPVLGICYGAQFMAKFYGGEVKASGSREYGRAHLSILKNDPILKAFPEGLPYGCRMETALPVFRKEPFFLVAPRDLTTLPSGWKAGMYTASSSTRKFSTAKKAVRCFLTSATRFAAAPAAGRQRVS